MISATYLSQWTDELAEALTWHLEWGDRLQDLLDIAEETGHEPRALQDRPQLGEEHAFVWGAFWALEGTRRSSGFGLEPLSFLEIEAWCRMNGVALEPWERRALNAMDRTRLKHEADRQRDEARRRDAARR